VGARAPTSSKGEIMARRFLTTLGLHVSTTDPQDGSDGEVYFNSDTNELKVYYSGAWNSISAGSGGGTSVTDAGVELSTTWWLGA